MLTTHLTTSSTSSSTSSISPSTSYSTGICLSLSLQQKFAFEQFWILDFGASRHICSFPLAFSSLRPIESTNVTLPNSITIPVLFSGDVKSTADITLRDVLFVPRFHFNLILVSALNQSTPLMLIFFPTHFTIQELPTKRMIGRGERVEGLYIFDTKNVYNQSFALVSVSNKSNKIVMSTYVNHVSAKIWHHRLGHPSHKRFDSLKSVLHCKDKVYPGAPCCICPLAKQRQLSFCVQ